MQTYKAFMKIALKNSPSSMIYFVVFIVICIIASSQGAEAEKLTYKDEAIPFTVFNRDESQLGEAIKDYLSERNEYVELKDEEETIREALYYREIYYAVVIPEGYEDAIKNGNDTELMNYKVTDSAMAYYMDMSVDNYIQTLKAYMEAGYDITESQEKTDEALLGSVDIQLLSDTDNGEISGNPIGGAISTKPSYYFFYQYVPYIFLAIMITAIGPVILSFGKKDIKMRVNVSAQTFKSHNAQIVLGVVTYGLIALMMFNIMGLLLYASDIPSGAKIGYILLTTCFLMVCLGVTFFGGAVFSKSATMGAFANVISLGFSFLGGIFVPLELLGEGMKNIARFTPTYWYVQSNDVIIGAEKFSDISMDKLAVNCGMQLLFAAAFFCAGLAVLSHKREES